jgi:hypothetical protein
LKLKLNYDRQSVGQSVLVISVIHPSASRDQFFFLLEIFFRQFGVSYFVAPSLTRRRVCNIQFLLVLASAVPRDSDHILLYKFFSLPQPGGPGPHIYIPQEQDDPDIPPGHWVMLCLLRLSYGRQSVLVSGSPLWPMTRFYPYSFFSDNCFVVLPVGRPL